MSLLSGELVSLLEGELLDLWLKVFIIYGASSIIIPVVLFLIPNLGLLCLLRVFSLLVSLFKLLIMDSIPYGGVIKTGLYLTLLFGDEYC